VTEAALSALPLVLLGFIGATVASLLLTPLAMRHAGRIGAIDTPDDERRVHRLPIPRTGGLAVAASFIGVGVSVVLLNDALNLVPQLRSFPDRAHVIALFAGAGIGAGLGFLDDRLQLPARWQFAGQLALAAFALIAGISIRFIDNPLGPGRLVFDDYLVGLAGAITAVWIVGMINSINFVDGLDGLSSGIALIATATLGVISLIVLSQPAVAILCAVLAGALLGFLPYNFYPARVFIGTAGVFAVGYALAVLSVLGTAKVAVALLVLGVPIIDTFWIIVRRVAAGRSPFSADRGHFHHRLLDLGLTHRGAVLLIYALCGLLAVLTLILAAARDSGRGQLSAFLLIVVGGGLVLYFMTRRTDEALDRRSYPDEPASAPER
jgi:UDP-GlcNAc:undecaprenyl-phosphate/decaprenyl-phosphate GlcNAc-1-phosphate transferase